MSINMYVNGSLTKLRLAYEKNSLCFSNPKLKQHTQYGIEGLHNIVLSEEVIKSTDASLDHQRVEVRVIAFKIILCMPIQ